MQPVNCLKTTPGLSDCKPYQATVLCNHSSNGPILHLQLPKLGTQEKLAPSLSRCSAECGIRESQDCDKAIRSPHKECCFSLALCERALAQHPVYPCGLPNHHRAGLRLQSTRHMLRCLVSTCLSRASFPHLASGGAQQGATCAASRRVSASNKACSQRPRSLSTASRSCHPITRTPLAPARTCTHHAPVDKAATVACLYAWQLPLLNGRSHRLHALRAIFVAIDDIIPTAVPAFTAANSVIPSIIPTAVPAFTAVIVVIPPILPTAVPAITALWSSIKRVACAQIQGHAMCTATLGRSILEFALDCCAPSTRYGIVTIRVANQQVVARPSVAHLGGKLNTVDSRVPGDSTTRQPHHSRV